MFHFHDYGWKTILSDLEGGASELFFSVFFTGGV